MTTRDITGELAEFAIRTQFEDLPATIQNEAVRTFVNWMGCVLGGCRDAAVDIADATVSESMEGPQASLIGRGKLASVSSAAFVNCLSSTVNSFDDTHLATVTHPTGPVAAALFAYSQKHQVSGKDFLNALALGIEIECRLSNVLLMPPAKANLGLFITGITGPIGAAIALGKLMGLDHERMIAAIGLSAAQAAGFRATHGAMSAFFIPAHAARTAVWAAMLAQKGFTSTPHMLQAPKGLIETFTSGANLDLAVEGLGEHFELMSNAYKPYPSGIVVQPTIDACLEIAAQLTPASVMTSVDLRVHPLALDLTGRRHPKNPVEAQISLFHWAAVCLLQGRAGLPQLEQRCIDAPLTVEWRNKITATSDPSLGRDEAWVKVVLADGRELTAHVEHARGSKERPMTDQELDAKFMDQAVMVLPGHMASKLLAECRGAIHLQDIGHQLASVWQAH